MMEMMKCKYKDVCGYDICIEEFCREYEPVKQNMGDRIREMDNDELAWLLMEFRVDAYAKSCGNESVYPNTKKKIVEWLNAPAEVK